MNKVMTSARAIWHNRRLIRRKLHKILEKLQNYDELEESICVILDYDSHKNSYIFKLQKYAILYLEYYDTRQLLLD